VEVNDYHVSPTELQQLEKRGYNQDLLPKDETKRNMDAKNYFTLWMGSIHNIPNYTAVGGFLFLGLSPLNVMLALVISAVVVAGFMTVNGIVGLQNYTGSLALLILIGKIWPGFLELGGDTMILGISIPGLIAFTAFWLLNVTIGFGGGNILNKFTAILTPLIYIVFGGMAIWAFTVAGGMGPILSYDTVGVTRSIHPLFGYLMVINSVLAVWAAPGASVSDFTQNAKSTKQQAVGQTLGLVIGYAIFAIFSVVILIGGSIHYNIQEWNVLNIIDRWDNFPAIILAMAVFLLTTISTNATGNIIPAAYQLTALFPKKINYKKGVLIASIISFVIMPWKLMENADSIFIFLNTIGAVLGPVAGVMLTHYFFVNKQQIDLDKLYMDPTKNNKNNQYHGINRQAYIATIIALLLSLSGQFISSLKMISDISWLVGFAAASIIYLGLQKFSTKTND
jgi:allantoin permease